MKALHIPIHETLEEIVKLPYTISYVFRKRVQIDNLNELPSEKRPPENILWHNNPDKLTKWIKKVTGKAEEKVEQDIISFPIGEVE